jgi:hypothetical protein
MARSTDFPRSGQAGSAHVRSGGSRPELADNGQDLESDFDRDVTGRAEEDEEEESDEYQTDWRQIGTLGVGIAIGVAVGAGIALLLAPMSGEETRDLIGDRARRLRGRAADSWDDLRDELRWAARRGRKRVRRGATRGRWAAEDAVDKARRRATW